MSSEHQKKLKFNEFLSKYKIKPEEEKALNDCTRKRASLGFLIGGAVSFVLTKHLILKNASLIFPLSSFSQKALPFMSSAVGGFYGCAYGYSSGLNKFFEMKQFRIPREYSRIFEGKYYEPEIEDENEGNFPSDEPWKSSSWNRVSKEDDGLSRDDYQEEISSSWDRIRKGNRDNRNLSSSQMLSGEETQEQFSSWDRIRNKANIRGDAREREESINRSSWDKIREVNNPFPMNSEPKKGKNKFGDEMESD